MVGLDVPVKFGASISNGSRDIEQRSRRIQHFSNFRPEVHSNVVSGMVVGPTDVKVRVKFGDSQR